jgi:hypothetical protein
MKCGLVNDVERLIQEQSVAWPLLAEGVRGLRESRTRMERIGWYEILIRHIPHRIKSTSAAVDPVSVSKRPCFLCSANLPPEERGVALSSEFTVYCNPYPILDKHLTIVHSAHRPQAISGQVTSLLEIAEVLPGFFLIYNGPQCGASAPDHLHFQACSRAIFPIEKETQDLAGPDVPNYGRRVVILRGRDIADLSVRIERLIAILADVTGKSPEPLLNIAAFHDEGQWTVFVFPREKHRPRVYETGELTVSPATIDLAGVFVVPLPGDFSRITGADIAQIFEEVTLSPPAFSAVLARLERTKS